MSDFDKSKKAAAEEASITDEPRLMSALERSPDPAHRALAARMDARRNGGILQYPFSCHIRFEAHAPSHKARVFYVGQHGMEVEISDCCRRVVFDIEAGSPPVATLECYAVADMNLDGEYLLRESETPRTMEAPAAPRPATDKTLEQYLKDAHARGCIDHAIRAEVDDRGRVYFYIHPSGVDGETCDYQLRGNLMRPDPRKTRSDFEGLW